MFVPVSNAAQIVLQFEQHDGSPAINEFWVQKSSAWSHANLVAMCNGFAAWYQTGDGTHTYQSLQNEATSLVGVAGRDMTTQAGIVANATADVPAAGTETDGNVPLGLSWTLTARTGLAGISYRGRTFLVDLDVGFWSNLAANEIDGAHASDAVDAFNSLITAVPDAVAGCALVVCSRVHNGVLRDAGLTTPVVSYGYRNLITDFQRRRAPAHNRHR